MSVRPIDRNALEQRPGGRGGTFPPQVEVQWRAGHGVSQQPHPAAEGDGCEQRGHSVQRSSASAGGPPGWALDRECVDAELEVALEGGAGAAVLRDGRGMEEAMRSQTETTLTIRMIKCRDCAHFHLLYVQ